MGKIHAWCRKSITKIRLVAKCDRHLCKKGRVSKTAGPRKKITGKDVKFNRDCKLETRCYVQANEHPDPSNRPEDHRSVGEIALGPSENEEGGYYFMIVETGKRINRFK